MFSLSYIHSNYLRRPFLASTSLRPSQVQGNDSRGCKGYGWGQDTWTEGYTCWDTAYIWGANVELKKAAQCKCKPFPTHWDHSWLILCRVTLYPVLWASQTMHGRPVTQMDILLLPGTGLRSLGLMNGNRWAHYLVSQSLTIHITGNVLAEPYLRSLIDSALLTRWIHLLSTISTCDWH